MEIKKMRGEIIHYRNYRNNKKVMEIITGPEPVELIGTNKEYRN